MNGVVKMVPRLLEKYRTEIVPKLVKELELKNVMLVPKLVKVVVNIGQGAAKTESKLLEASQKELASITGQHPIITRAKRAIASFGIRQGMPIGCSVTLRSYKAYEFLDRLINVALPRVRDFRGVSRKSFDGNGNYTLGIKEQIIFPEIEYDKVARISGMNVTIVIKSQSDEHSLKLLEYLNMPFRKK